MKVKKCRDKRNKSSPWTVRFSYGPDPVTGKEKWLSESFRWKAQRDQRAAELLAGVEPAPSQRAEGVMLKEFCQDWQRTMKSRLRPKTRQLYQGTIERLIDYFGPSCLLAEITPRLADKFFAELKGQRRETLSNWTKHRILRNCRTIFQTAVDWEQLKNNPFKKVKAPKCRSQRWYYLTPAEYNRLLKVAPSLRTKALYALAYTGGLRAGEAYSLMWDDIDFDQGKIRIDNRPATATNPPFLVKDFESRVISLPPHTLDILADLKAYNEVTDRTPYLLLDDRRYELVMGKWKDYQTKGRDWSNQDILNNTVRNFKRHYKKAGIKPVGELTIHTLRKCAGKNWAMVNKDMKTTQELMGHADLSTTLKYYDQVTEDDRKQAAAAIDSLVRMRYVSSEFGAK